MPQQTEPAPEMILSTERDLFATIERFDVEPARQEEAVTRASATIHDGWRHDPGFIAALVLRGRHHGGLAIYVQWRRPEAGTVPATPAAGRSLRGALEAFPMVDSRNYALAFTRQALPMTMPTRISRGGTPFIHFGVFGVTRENQPVMLARAEAEAPNAFGTPAVRSNHNLRFLENWTLIETDPFTIADDLAPEAWATHAAGEGAKGLRLYDWAWVPLPWTRPDGFEPHLLIRRHRRDPDKRAYYLVFCRAGTTLAELAGAAGLRWTVEECFGRAKDDLGLDHCEARSWHGWHRHVTLVMAAAAFLARLAADLRRTAWDLPQSAPAPLGKANETSPNVLAA